MLEKEVGETAVQKRVLIVGDLDLYWGDVARQRLRTAGYSPITDPAQSLAFSFAEGHRALVACNGNRPELAVIGERKTDDREVARFIGLAHLLDAEHHRNKLPFLLLTRVPPAGRYGAYYQYEQVTTCMQNEVLDEKKFLESIAEAESAGCPTITSRTRVAPGKESAYSPKRLVG